MLDTPVDMMYGTENKASRDLPKTSAAPSQAKDEIENLNRQSQHIQDLIDQVNELPDASARDIMQECIAEISSLYGKGLEKIIDILMEENSPAATRIMNRIMENSFVSGLLLIHDLHPLDLSTRLRFALEKVRPYMESHGGNVEIVSLHEGVAKLRLSGTCKGCASSSVTLELAIKQAIEENCPDLLALEVEGVVESKSHDGKLAAAQPTPSTVKWKTINGISGLKNGATQFFESDDVPLIICKVNERLFAYRNVCPACDLPLSTGTLTDHVISCRLGHSYDILQAGKCVNDPNLHLDPFPLLQENGSVKVALSV